MPFAKNKDIQLFFKQSGLGPDLILIGGLSATHETFHHIRPLLEKHFRVTAFDNRGAGQSSAPDEAFTTLDMAKDVIAIMDHLNIKKAHILGQSMGSYITQQCLLHFPDRFQKAIMMSSRTKASARTNLHFAVQGELMQQGIELDLALKNMMTFLFGPDYLNDENNIKNFIKFAKEQPRQPPIGLKRQLEANLGHDCSNELHKVQHETLVIHGKDDILRTPDNAKELKAALPNATLTLLDGVGHVPQLEAAENTADEVINFLN